MLVAFNSLNGKPLDLSSSNIYEIDITRITPSGSMYCECTSQDGGTIHVAPGAHGRWYAWPDNAKGVYENVYNTDYVGQLTYCGIVEVKDGQG